MDNSAHKIFNTNVPHIPEKIFLHLDLQTFKNCHVVCKSWNDVLSRESFRKKTKKILTENNSKLWRASRKGDTDEVKRILHTGMVAIDSHRDKFCVGSSICYATPLKIASCYGNKDVVQILVKAGADVNKADKKGHTPLQSATSFGRNDIAEMLLDYGADPKRADEDGLAPLHKAAGDDNCGLVKLLIERGAEVNMCTRFGLTPLNYAKMFKRRRVVKLLIDRGANYGQIRYVKKSIEAKMQDDA